MAKYDISKEFGLFAHFHPPVCRALLPAINLALGLGALLVRPRPGVTLRRVKYPGYQDRMVRALLIEPEGEQGELPLFLYLHGGGFVMKAAWTHIHLAMEYAKSVPCRVLMPDYSLAPQHPYPAAAEDCYAAYEWARKNARTLRIDPSRIAMGGESAGGCLAAALTHMARDRKAPPPCFMLLVYPVTDRRMVTASMREFTDTPMWNARLNKRMWRWYAPEPDSPYASPMEASSLAGLPDAYVETAEFDCLRDEGENYYHALQAAGVSVEYNPTRHTMHGYDAAENAPAVLSATLRRIAELRMAFGHGGKDDG